MTTELNALVSEINAIKIEIEEIKNSPEYKYYIDASDMLLNQNDVKLDSTCITKCCEFKTDIKIKKNRLGDLLYRQSQLQMLITNIVLDL